MFGIGRWVLAVALGIGVVAGTACGGGSKTPKPTTTSARIARAETILQDFVKAKYPDARKGFTTQLDSAFDTKAMTDTWQRFVHDFGDYKSHGKSSEVTSGSTKVVDVPLVMSKAPGVLRVGFSPQGQTTGIFFLKPGIPVGSEGANGQPTPALANAALQVVEQMRTDAFDALGKTFSTSMAATTNPQDIRKGWQGAVGQLGNYVSVGQPQVVPVTGAVLYDIPVTLEKGPIHVQVVIESDAKLDGISIQPGAPTGTFGK
jgi:hypothetical protein